MTARILSKNADKILVVGPVYNKLEQIRRAASLIPEYDYTIFNGSLCYPNDNLAEVRDRIRIMDDLLKTRKVIYNLSHYDMLLSQDLDNAKVAPDILNWIWSKPNVVIVDFKSVQSTTIITAGGVSPKMTREKLMDNLETSFISKINNVSWHQVYGGMYGYIISNNPLTWKEPEFHRFSAQIGNFYGEKTEVYAQEVDGFGLKRTILL